MGWLSGKDLPSMSGTLNSIFSTTKIKTQRKEKEAGVKGSDSSFHLETE